MAVVRGDGAYALSFISGGRLGSMVAAPPPPPPPPRVAASPSARHIEFVCLFVVVVFAPRRRSCSAATHAAASREADPTDGMGQLQGCQIGSDWEGHLATLVSYRVARLGQSTHSLPIANFPPRRGGPSISPLSDWAGSDWPVSPTSVGQPLARLKS